MGATFREISRGEYSPPEGPTLEAIKVGSVQRIADAAEKMAINHAELLRERDKYLTWFREEQAKNKKLEASLSATHGVVTRCKNRIARLEEDVEFYRQKVQAIGIPATAPTPAEVQPEGGT